MAQPPLTRAQGQQALNAVQTHGNFTKAAAALNMPRGTLQNRVVRAKAMGLVEGMPEPVEPIREPLTSFEEAWQQWQREIGMAKDRYVRTTSTHTAGADNVSTTSTQKILVVPDLHAPFHEPQMFAEMLRAEADADHCICIGDLGDAYALSRFMKYQHMPYRDEWASVTLVMQELASRFPKVTIVIGNHDARLEKQLRTHLTEDMVDAIGFMTGGILCPITALAKRYPNVEIARHVTPGGQHVDWFTTIGDAWLGHPEKYSRVPGSALRFTEEWIADNEASIGLEGARLIVMGHTHTYAQIPWRAGKLLVECGCLCQQQGYMLSPRIGGRPQRRGYLTFNQTEGVTDLNSVKFRWLDVEAVA